MSTNQELRHAAVRAVTGTTGTYNEDWISLFDNDGIAAGTFNERFLLWLEGKNGVTGLTLGEQMTLFAINEGVDQWNALGTFDASGGGGSDPSGGLDNLIFVEDGDNLLMAESADDVLLFVE